MNMTTEAPLQIKATMSRDCSSEGWADLRRTLTKEEMHGVTMYAHAVFDRVATDWAENSPLQVSMFGTNICIAVAPLEDDGDNVLEFEVPLADVIMTGPAWELRDAAPLAALLRQLADQLEAATN